jgi:tRNA(Ile)-lysidine synthase
VHSFPRNLITEWRRLELPFRDEAIVVGVSGGADSMSLLLAISELRERKKLDLRIVVAHFDHKIRPDSDADLEFVADFAKSHHFEMSHGGWDRTAHGNLEQNARNARYDFLKATASSVNGACILTAHTMNDQAETFLMNLIRGAGPDGLSGMRPVRALEAKLLIEQKENGKAAEEPFLPFSSIPLLHARPLLRWAKRRDTENFCLEHKIDFRRDPMNEDLNFRRIWVRKVLIPMMEEANPKLVESLCRTAELMRGESQPAEVPKTPDSGSHLDVAHLRTLEKTDLFPVLRDWIKLNRGSLRGISTKHIDAIYSLIHSQKSGRVAELPGGDAVKHDGRLSWSHRTPEKG